MAQINKTALFIVRVFVCFVILALGVTAFVGGMILKKAPKERSPEVLRRKLIGTKMKAKSIQLSISGYGTARPTREIEISSEIKGRVVFTNDTLSDGELVEKGAVLARIDLDDYKIALKEAEADLAVLRASKVKMEKDIETGKLVLETLKANLELQKKTLARIEKLYDKKIISSSQLEQSQQELEDKKNRYLVDKGHLEVMETELQVIAAEIDRGATKKEMAEINLARAEIRSPFRGRLKNVEIEDGEYVNAGQRLFMIADDKNLEIPVSLDAFEAARIIGLTRKGEAYKHWFEIPSIPIVIEWTEEPASCRWEGRILRVEGFDPATRTATVLVEPTKRIEGDNYSCSFPLVAGMFCKVTFIGRKLEKAFKIPWNAIQLDRNVFVADDNGVLQERNVDIFCSEGDHAIISEGIKDGENLIVQRLPRGIVNGMKVDIIQPEPETIHNVSSTDNPDSKPRPN